MAKTQIRHLVIAICAVLALTLLSFSVASLNASADPANSNFEGVTDGLPMGWINVSGNASMDYSESMSGTASLKLKGASSAVRQRYIPAVGGETYTIKAQVKVDNENARPYIEATSYNGAMCLNATQSTGGTQTFTVGEWNELTLVYTAAPTATYIEVLLSSGNNDATIWIDSVSISGAVSDSAGNRIKNGSFDTDASQWATSGTVSYDSSVGYVGNGSMKITATGGNGVNFSQDGIFVTPGKTYEIKLHYMSDVANVRPEIQGYTYLGGGEIGTAIADMTAETAGVENTWNEYAVEYTVPANVPAMKLIFTAIAPEGANIWIDAVSVCDVDEVGDADVVLPESNLVTNCGFEDGKTNWTPSVAASFTIDDAQSVDGTSSAKVDTTRIYQDVKVEGSTVYRIGTYHTNGGSSAWTRIRAEWYGESGNLSGENYDCKTLSSKWTNFEITVMAPKDATTLRLCLYAYDGSVWFDNVYVDAVKTDDSNNVSNGGFEYGLTNWSKYTYGTYTIDSTKKNEGVYSLKLNNSDGNNIANVKQYVPVEADKTYEISAYFCTDNPDARPFLNLMWYDESNAIIGSNFTVTAPSGSETWEKLKTVLKAPEGATQLYFEFNIRNTVANVWVDSISVVKTESAVLYSAYGEPINVYNIVNINESFYDPSDSNPNNDDPAKFWEMIPTAELNEPTKVMWTEPFFRHVYFGNTDGVSGGTRFKLPDIIKNRDATTSHLSGLLGKSTASGPSLAVATDIEFNPFMKAHDSYSYRYYPRRQHDYISTEYAPSYVLTGDEYFKTRATQLLDFLKFSQWQADGSNAFTEKYYSGHSNSAEAYTLHPEWRGGWDYLFDWLWKDASGYVWTYHETDHHVCSQAVRTIINAYEVFDLDESYLDMCREFVYYQIPRYGFHKGEWNGHTYYWTEYNPTGESKGNPVDDAVDNVQALVAEAVSMVAYYETDPILKARYLEFARGLIWYLVREYEMDGRWYYDGAENPTNARKAISHDAVSTYSTWHALAYLYKAGVDVDELLTYCDRINMEYSAIDGTLQRKRYIQVAKVYDGVPARGKNMKFTSFINVTSEDLGNARFSDSIPSYGFIVPARLNVRISHILPPNASTDDWTVDSSQDVVYTVTPAQLEAGINIPFTLKYGEQYRVSYSIRVTSDSAFSRSAVTDTASAVSAWVVDEDNNATFVKATSETSAHTEKGFTEPFSLDTTVDSSNFLSFGADLSFRFDREMTSEFADTTAPLAKSYKESDNWADIDADAYIYPIQTIYADLIKASVSSSHTAVVDRGRIFAFKGAGQFASFNIFVPSSDGKFNVYASYMKANSRGISQMYLDGVKQGGTYDLYADTPHSAPQIVENIPLGTANLSAGNHELKITVTGRNSASSGYEIGVYDALVLRPVK